MDFKEWYGKVYNIARIHGYKKTTALGLAVQGWLESGKLESKLTVEAHNCFGMKVPTKRISHRIGETYMCNKSGGDCAYYSVYKNIEQSIIDRIELDSWNFRKKGESYKSLGAMEYLKTIQALGYATHPKYMELLQTVMDSNSMNTGGNGNDIGIVQTNQNKPIIILIILVILLITYKFFM